jgi:hypothetical protein
MAAAAAAATSFGGGGGGGGGGGAGADIIADFPAASAWMGANAPSGKLDSTGLLKQQAADHAAALNKILVPALAMDVAAKRGPLIKQLKAVIKLIASAISCNPGVVDVESVAEARVIGATKYDVATAMLASRRWSTVLSVETLATWGPGAYLCVSTRVPVPHAWRSFADAQCVLEAALHVSLPAPFAMAYSNVALVRDVSYAAQAVMVELDRKYAIGGRATAVAVGVVHAILAAFEMPGSAPLGNLDGPPAKVMPSIGAIAKSFCWMEDGMVLALTSLGGDSYDIRRLDGSACVAAVTKDVEALLRTGCKARVDFPPRLVPQEFRRDQDGVPREDASHHLATHRARRRGPPPAGGLGLALAPRGGGRGALGGRCCGEGEQQQRR